MNKKIKVPDLTDREYFTPFELANESWFPRNKIMSEEKNKKKVVDNELEDVVLDKRLEKCFSIQKVWNDKLTFGREERKLEPRDYMWATEIGMNYFDRWHKMQGIKAEEDYNERTLRKFEAGNLFEKMVGFVIALSGIMIGEQEHVEVPATKDTLKITGYIDYIAGGKPKLWSEIIDNDFVKLYFKFFPTYENIAKAANEVIRKNYELGLPTYIIEVKSVNSQLFWAKKDYLQDAYKHHQLQTLTYLKAKNLKEGRILYISKDDLTLLEFPVYLNDIKLNEIWNKDVKEMTEIYRSGKKPAVPDLITFDERKKINFTFNKKKYFITGAYNENWQVKWSNYKKQMGFKDEDAFMSKAHPLMLNANNLIKDEFKNKHGLIKKK